VKILRYSLLVIGLLLAILSQTGIVEASCGSWSVVPSPNPPGDDTLFAVTAISSHDAWAVGSSNQQSPSPQTLTIHWDGTKWNLVSSPNPGPTFNKLLAVTALSTINVWAVGYYQTSAGSVQALIEHWDGSKWSVVPGPNTSSSINQLYSIAAFSATDIWAVGVSQPNNNTQQTLIEHWNGIKWNVVPSPNPGSSFNILRSVAVVSASSAWAVGNYNNSQGIPQTLIEHWNGNKWSVVASPNPGSSINSLYGVTYVPGTTQLWAVGTYSNGSGGQTLTERWNGNRWTVVASPTIQANSNVLESVVAISPSDVWTVGLSGTPTGIVSQTSSSNPAGRALTEHWDGVRWSIVSSPNAGTFNNSLNSVVHVPGTNQLWAVGAYNNGSPPVQTLIEWYHC